MYLRSLQEDSLESKEVHRAMSPSFHVVMYIKRKMKSNHW